MATPVQTMIVLANGDKIGTTENVVEVKMRLESVKGKHPFIAITDTDGREHWVRSREVAHLFGQPDSPGDPAVVS